MQHATAYYKGGAAAAANAVDLLSVMAAHIYEWLDELSAIHAAIIETGAARSPDMWLSGATRLDARPWGQAALIKPLLFARAIFTWLKDNPSATGLIVIGASPDTARHLRALAPDLDIRPDADTKPDNRFSMPRLLRLMYWAWHDFLSVLRHHRVPQRRWRSTTATLFLVQSVRGQPLKDSHRYFFTSHLDAISADENPVALMGTVDRSGREGDPDKSGQTPLCLYDGVTIVEAASAFCRAVRQSTTIYRLFAKEGAGHRSAGATPLFWRRFARQLVDPGELFHAFLTRSRLRSLTAATRCRQVIYPYEEKSNERGIIQACKDAGVKTLGYVPHPQHRLLTALQDRPGTSCPKPDGYTVCGTGYIDFFRNWAGKHNASISVWGSGKGIDKGPATISAGADRPSVLLALSHPEELAILRLWIRVCPEIAEQADLVLRPYPAADPDLFEAALRDIRIQHSNLSVSTGDLELDVRAHHAVAFCATSAGPEAILMGALGLFIDLTDGFPINPCFDDTSVFRPSFNPGELAENLAWLKQANEAEIREQRARQIKVVTQIFGPPNENAVLNSIRCAE